MQDEKWQNLVGRVKDEFEVLESKKEDLGEESGPGFVEFIVFNGPLGKIKLERFSRPIVLDKKTVGSKRIGGETAVKYIYSDSEFSHKFRAYKWNEARGEWEEMEASSFE
ncbi:MAG: hypothetical protein PHD51_00845 [Patescibacteria group bacterium]|nr:hypothetical protein [Patescibacteria group bacterium]MDD5490589.1 hypothetical protein [Patescibacteria group bacterium]